MSSIDDNRRKDTRNNNDNPLDSLNQAHSAARKAKTGKSSTETTVIGPRQPGYNSNVLTGYNKNANKNTMVTLAAHLLQLNEDDSKQKDISDDEKTEVTSNSTNKNSTTLKESEPHDEFVEVVSKGSMKDILSAKKNRFGIHFSRISSTTEAGFHPDDLKFILTRILEQDPHAIFLPYSNNDKRAQKLSKLVSSQSINYNNLIDSVCTPWGRPSENKCKSEFSFYLASDMITANLRQLKEDDKMMEFLKAASIWMSAHALHQTSTKQVGFFLGKTPKHTSPIDLLQRLRNSFLYTNQQQDGLATDVPLQIKQTKIQVDEVTAEALVLIVGAKDYPAIQALVQRINFQVEIVPMKWKRSQNKEFKERLKLHNGMCNNSTAVKIDSITEDVLIALHGRIQASKEKTVIDITRSVRTTSMVYIQCLLQNKDKVITACDTFFAEIANIHPGITIPTILNRTAAPSSDTSTFTKSHESTTCWDSKYKDLITEFSPTSLTSVKQPRHVPKHINTQCKSYADILLQKSDGKSTSSDPPSALSSPTASCNGTEKTQRELELESIVEGLQRQVEEKTEMCDVLREKLEEQSAQILAITEVNRKNTDEIEILKQAFAALQSAHHPANSPHRKKIDNKPTPSKTPRDLGIDPHNLDMDIDIDNDKLSDYSNSISSPVSTKDAISDGTFKSC
jgi:hypothetical protein